MLNKDFFESVLGNDTNIVTVKPKTPKMPEDVLEERLRIAAGDIDTFLQLITHEEERNSMAKVAKGTTRTTTIETDVNAGNEITCKTTWNYIDDGKITIEYRGNEEELPYINIKVKRYYHSGVIVFESTRTKTNIGATEIVLYPHDQKNKAFLRFQIKMTEVIGKLIQGNDLQRAKEELANIFGNINFPRLQTNSEYVVTMYEKFRKELFGVI